VKLVTYYVPILQGFVAHYMLWCDSIQLIRRVNVWKKGPFKSSIHLDAPNLPVDRDPYGNMYKFCLKQLLCLCMIFASYIAKDNGLAM
jgi:hypothetical protein